MFLLPACFSNMTFKLVFDHFKEYLVVNPRFSNLAYIEDYYGRITILPCCAQSK